MADAKAYHSGWKYDVFLSFRGEDMHMNFTDHLYYALRDAGIHVFTDDRVIRRGEHITSQLRNAIRGSKLAVIVFSQRYARSRWCLEELVTIMQCVRTPRQLVLPIFYDVSPSDVRKQTGSFKEAFARHEEHSSGDIDRVLRWRGALTEAANLSGWELKNTADGCEAKFVKLIVENISMKLNKTCLFVARNPVGIDSRTKAIISRLDVRSGRVRMVGIWGMTGIGKTTIAKAIYNQLSHKFEGTCFLANISEISKQPDGHVHLQEQLLSSVLNSDRQKIFSVDHGISLLREILRRKRVLVILDDVEQMEQLYGLARRREWFGPGSRIIITTRYEHLLNQLQVDAICKIDEMNKTEALELFSWHAFRKGDPDEAFYELSKSFVNHCGGLPLALVIVGSFLFGRSIPEWQDTLDKLKTMLNDQIQKTLGINYEGPSDHLHKDTILDISGHLIGMDKNDTSMKLDKTCLFVARNPVGIDSRTKAIISSLDVGSGGVRMVCIWGIEGIGKTTIAKAIYNQLKHNFKGSCFLANIKEISKQPSGHVHLQEQLLSSILKSHKLKIFSVDRGINMLQKRLRRKSVLVILDDVDQMEQLNALARSREWFGSGSRIIITTRDEHLLNQLQVDAICKVDEMNKTEALELFSWHAFRKGDPDEAFYELSKIFVNYCGGLPLALESLGSFLFGRSIHEWKGTLCKLEKNPNDQIQKMLGINFKGPSDHLHKDIILDISGHLIGIDKNDTSMKLDKNDTSMKLDKNDTSMKIDKNDTSMKLDKNDTSMKLDKNDTSMKLDKTCLFVARNPVGIYSRAKSIISRLDVGSGGVRMVGIWGMGGIGKTTIAKAIYNQLSHNFEGTCFLANIKEISKQPDGYAHLQEQLLSSVLNAHELKIFNVDHGINLLQERLCRKSVLVILDDVDQMEQLNTLVRSREWFGPGSRIIITTRDELLLNQLQVDAICKVDEMNETEALELFSWHAFQKSDPDEALYELSRSFVNYCGGLPFALEVLGSFLFGKSIHEWKDSLHKLKTNPNHQIQKNLRTSYEDNITLVHIPPDERMITLERSGGAKRWGLGRSFVLGGLIESITSLVIVTSAATANISDGDLVALALTNLITGLFIIRHNLAGFKKNKLKKGSIETEVEQASRYKEVLGDIMHYLLHFLVAILSFIFFGLVSPLVYAFSFPKTGNKDLKIIAAAGASLSCTAFLAIAKAHLQKPENWLVHLKTTACYVSIGIGAFGLSYLAGDMFAKLTEKLWLVE